MKKGFILVALMFVLLFVATVGMTTLYIFRSATLEDTEHKQSIQALGIAQGGIQWTLRALKDSTDWIGLASQLNGQTIAMGSGYFQVGIQSSTTTSTTVRVTGNVSALNGAILKRTIQVRVSKIPKEFQFVAYSPGVQTTLLQNSTIYGDYFNGANTDVDHTSSVTGGYVYVPTGNQVAGDGNYAWSAVADPVPQSVPPVDATYYTGLMNTYDTYFTNNTNRSLSGTVNLSAAPWNGTMLGRRITFSGNCAIIGSGIIAASDYIYSNTGFRLNIAPSPSGNKIVLAARNEIRLYGQTLSINASNVTMYSQNSYIRIWYPYAEIRNALFLTRNGPLDIDYGAHVYTSLAYLMTSNPANTSFSLQSHTGYPSSYYSGTVISRGTGVFGGVSGAPVYFYGLYWNDARTQIDYLQFQGALLSEQFALNKIMNSNLTLNMAVMPYPPPVGFEGAATIEPGSWRVDE